MKELRIAGAFAHYALPILVLVVFLLAVFLGKPLIVVAAVFSALRLGTRTVSSIRRRFSLSSTGESL